jgi:hypothetical protein
MTKDQPLLILFGVLLLSGCSTQVPVKVEPTMMSSSVDFTSPATVAGNSAPVYVLPVINTGWEKAYVDPRTGTWKSGRYTATIVEEGYWTTQEEAERSGKPFIIGGKGGPVMGGNIKPMGRSNTGVAELDIADVSNRIAKLEENAGKPQPAGLDPDLSAQTAARMNALAQQISPMGPNGQKMVQPDRGGYSPQMEVSADPSQKPPIKAGPASSDIVIPFKGPNKPITYEVPVGSRKERLTVNFTDELTAMLSINNGPERPIRLKRPRDPLVIRLK